MLNISLAKPFKTNSMPFPCAPKTDILQLVQVVGSYHDCICASVYQAFHHYTCSYTIKTNILQLSVSGSARPGHYNEGNAGSQEMDMKKSWLQFPAPLHFVCRNFKHAKPPVSRTNICEFALAWNGISLAPLAPKSTKKFDMRQHDACRVCRGQLCWLWTNASEVLQSSFATERGEGTGMARWNAAIAGAITNRLSDLKTVVSAVPWPPMRNHHSRLAFLEFDQKNYSTVNTCSFHFPACVHK